jgi:hypothetical protein
MVVTFVDFVGRRVTQVFGAEAQFASAFASDATIVTFFTFLSGFVFIFAGDPFVETTSGKLSFTMPLKEIPYCNSSDDCCIQVNTGTNPDNYLVQILRDYGVPAGLRVPPKRSNTCKILRHKGLSPFSDNNIILYIKVLSSYPTIPDELEGDTMYLP